MKVLLTLVALVVVSSSLCSAQMFRLNGSLGVGTNLIFIHTLRSPNYAYEFFDPEEATESEDHNFIVPTVTVSYGFAMPWIPVSRSVIIGLDLDTRISTSLSRS